MKITQRMFMTKKQTLLALISQQQGDQNACKMQNQNQNLRIQVLVTVQLLTQVLRDIIILVNVCQLFL